MSLTRSITLFSAAAAFLAGCSSTPVATPQPAVALAAQTAPSPMAATPARSPQAAAVSPVRSVMIPAHLDPKSAISSERSVYFDFDDDAIKKGDMALIERHAKYLSSTPAISIKVEGNADERGSAEYNLALGQRRAQSVVRALKIYGVPEGRMEPISWGKERPRATGHDESAWAQNRRADVAYPLR